MTAQRPPPCRGPYCAKLILLRIQFVRENLVLPNQSFTDPVLYGRPRPCRTKSESQASTSQLRQADRCQGTRKALARPSSAKASSRHNSARQTGAKANARRSLDQTVPGQSQDTLRGKHPPGKTPATTPPGRQVPRQTQGARQTKQRQGNRRTPSRPDRRQGTRRANPSGQATPDQAAPRYTNRNRQPPGRPAISVAEIRNY